MGNAGCQRDQWPPIRLAGPEKKSRKRSEKRRQKAGKSDWNHGSGSGQQQQRFVHERQAVEHFETQCQHVAFQWQCNGPATAATSAGRRKVQSAPALDSKTHGSGAEEARQEDAQAQAEAGAAEQVPTQDGQRSRAQPHEGNQRGLRDAASSHSAEPSALLQFLIKFQFEFQFQCSVSVQFEQFEQFEQLEQSEQQQPRKVDQDHDAATGHGLHRNAQSGAGLSDDTIGPGVFGQRQHAAQGQQLRRSGTGDGGLSQRSAVGSLVQSGRPARLLRRHSQHRHGRSFRHFPRIGRR